MTSTIGAIGELAKEVAGRFSGTELGAVAGSVVGGLNEPLRLAVAGRVKAGKSTLLNAIVGEALAPTDAGECTRVVTWYRHGLTRSATVEDHHGARRTVPLERGDDSVIVDLGVPADDVRRLEVAWPTSRLEAMTLIDTPGIGSVDPGAGGRALRMVSDEDPDRAVDAVVYLANQTHPSDWRFLEAFTDDAGLRPDPSCAVALVSRADEVAGGAPDALMQAAAAARRLAVDPAVRRNCQSVLPVSALLAAGAVRLTGDQHRMLAALASDARVDEALVTSSRFAGTDAREVGGLSVEVRRALVTQLGLFGVRGAIEMLQARPSTTAAELVATMRAQSGLDELLSLVNQQFLRRRDALRSRTSLRALSAAAHRHGEAAGAVLGTLERIEAADHELSELRLLAEWRAGALQIRDADGSELERWLDPPDDAAAPERAELLSGVERWRRLAEHPLTRPTEAAGALVVARAIERQLAG